MSVPIQPLADFVVAKAEAAESKTASGLYIPEKAAEKPKIATVLAVGPGVKEIKAGDKIVYGGYSNDEIKLSGEEYLLIKQENVYGIVK
ncbi:MAG: co-chaperone GroES [Candidatus Saccharibacteria bacterium]|nr:co-chaperone GroES [Candidatus Saccharibacteria bacterium]